MSRGKDLIKNTGILMLAKVSTQVVSFILLPLYTAILSTTDYGRIDVYTSLAMIIIPFLTLQVEMALFRYFITEKDHIDKKKIVTSSMTIVFLMIFFATFVYFLCSNFFVIPYKWYLYLYYLSLTINTVMLQMCRAEGDNIGYGLATFFSSGIAVLLNVLFVAYLRFGVQGMLLSSILAHSISSIFMVLRTKICSFFSFKYISFSSCKKLLHYSVPLIFNQVASWAINYSDRLIILTYLGESYNGIYSVACKFSNILNTFFGVYNVAWTENVIRSMEDSNKYEYISDVFNTTYKIYSILVTGIVNILPFIYGILINEKFSFSYYHVPFLLLGMMFSGLAASIGSIYIAYNKTKEVSITTTISGIINVVVHILLLPIIGLYAASISTLIAFFILFLYRLMTIRRFFTLKIDFKGTVIFNLILAFSCIAYFFQNKLIIGIGLGFNVLNIVFFLVSNKELILNFKRQKD